MPKNIEDYIHRIGRTGRVGNKGKAISFYNENNKQIGEALVNELKKSRQKIPDFLEEFDYYDYDYNNNITPFDENKEYNNDYYYYNNNDNMNKEKELFKKFEKYEKGNDKYYRNQYSYNNYRGRGFKNHNRGNYYKFKRNNEYNGNYRKDNWRK